MAAPSRLPSAKSVAERCFDKYQLESDPDCDAALRKDLEALAEHFVTLNTLQSVFIESLVPRSDFTRPSNSGHAAVADFLITRAAVAGISSNYDTLIERSAWEYGSDFQSSLDGDEAIACEARQGPLLKRSYRDRRSTVWAPSQLADRTIRERIEKSKTWMAASLRQKDLLIVGFWSDWEYLNRIIGIALEGVEPLSVTVIDPLPTEELQGKAPDLWHIAHGQNVIFEHVKESGSEALDRRRGAFRQVFYVRCWPRAATSSSRHPEWCVIPIGSWRRRSTPRRYTGGAGTQRAYRHLNPRRGFVLVTARRSASFISCFGRREPIGSLRDMN